MSASLFDEIRYFGYFQILMAQHNDFGKLGEDLAEEMLVRKGYEILRKNYRFRKAEIDILALKDDILAVIEVKSRRSEDWQSIGATIHRRKKELLIEAADHFVQQNEMDVEVRFDLISIIGPKENLIIDHLEGAFSPY